MLHIHQQVSLALLFTSIFDHVINANEDEIDSLPATISKEEVFSLVVSNYVDKLYRYINYNFWLQKAITDDVVQEIFLALPKKLHHFDTNKKLEPRLFKVAYNMTLDYIKKNKRRNDKEIEIDIIATEDFLYQVSSQEGELPQTLEKAYHEGLLRFVLHKLDQRSRQMIILYFFENKTYQEIATIIGVKPSWVGTLLARAKKQLKFQIQQDALLHDALIYDL